MVNNVISMRGVSEGDFYQLWARLMQPFARLTRQETEVFGIMVETWMGMDDGMREKVWVSYVRKEVRSRLNISESQYSQVLGKLKRKGVIDGWRISGRLIPKLDGSRELTLVYHIEMEGES